MVQVIENRADIDGTVTAVKSAPDRPGHSLVTVNVDATSPVEGYRNLFAEAEGTPLDVLVPASAGPIRVGDKVRCRIRLAGPKIIFAEKYAPHSDP